jgi:excisionase family DNA binding protein
MKLLTIAEVAERLRLHPMTVRRHVKAGRIKATRIGRSIRVPEDAIDHLEPAVPRSGEESRKEWARKVFRPVTDEERAHRTKLAQEMTQLRAPLDIPVGVLKRASRREEEVVYGNKTWEQLIAEELKHENS